MVLNRRSLLWFPAVVRGLGQPAQRYGTMVGDVSVGAALVWSRAESAGGLEVEWSTRESFEGARRVSGSTAGPDSGLTARATLTGLPADQTIFYRARFGAGAASEGSFRTAPAGRRNVRFLWSGDMVGQGWGIRRDQPGIPIFDAMRRREPDFFIHSGDSIYADGPVPAEIKLPDGTVWQNVTTEAKSKVAETLEEFRGAYLYNLQDAYVRAFNAAVPQVWQWDDHEVVNNWSPGKDLRDDDRYNVKDIRTLVGRARQAYLEYAPIRSPRRGQIYRKIPYGPLLDVFVVDMRTFRGANSFNRQTAASAATAFLGREQMRWLERDLARSRAVWKVIAADMPIGLLVGDGKDAEGRPQLEAIANGDGPALGRELEIARLLASMKRNRVRNVVWLTADVHYTAAHHYHPDRAQFRDFDPFWEFVSGPLNAGTFGPGVPDDTFGIEVAYQKAPPKGQANLPPSAGMQFFGEVEIDGRSRALTVTLRDWRGASLFRREIEAS
ncbi:MAG: alkaline phosphatase D family protein [Bryobacteraceae bacterium]